MKWNLPSIAKITRPNISGVFPRKRLMSLLDGRRKQSLIWVSGPGGSGKTTLLASYLDERKLPCLWYQVDEYSGRPIDTVGPRAITIDPLGKFLYTANSGSNDVSGYSIDAGTGALTSLPGGPFAARTAPNAITADPSGKFVYATNWTSDDVSLFSIDTTGSLNREPYEPSVGALRLPLLRSKSSQLYARVCVHCE